MCREIKQYMNSDSLFFTRVDEVNTIYIVSSPIFVINVINGRFHHIDNLFNKISFKRFCLISNLNLESICGNR